MTDILREKAREYFGFGIKRMSGIKVCEICASAVSAGKHFCPNCRARLPHRTLYDLYKSNHRACARCKTVLSEFARYCPECGEKQPSTTKAYKHADNKTALQRSGKEWSQT